MQGDIILGRSKIETIKTKQTTEKTKPSAKELESIKKQIEKFERQSEEEKNKLQEFERTQKDELSNIFIDRSGLRVLFSDSEKDRRELTKMMMEIKRLYNN